MAARSFLPASASPDDAGEEDLRRWLRSTALLDLRDPKLRLRARALTQLSKGEREKAMAIYGFVKRIPFSKPMKLRLRTAREVLDAGTGDATDKSTLFLALLRAVKIPARLHYYQVNGDILRGLTTGIASAARGAVEMRLDGRWVGTDTYVFDAGYMAAARDRLRANGWEFGFGIHHNAQFIWNGRDPAYLGGVAPEDDPLVLHDMGHYEDEREFQDSDAYQHSPWLRNVRWNLRASGMNKVVRELRAQRPAAAQAAAVKKAS